MGNSDTFVTIFPEGKSRPYTVEPRHRTLLGRSFVALGPGLIANAPDDDPSGLATYSAARALVDAKGENRSKYVACF